VAALTWQECGNLRKNKLQQELFFNLHSGEISQQQDTVLGAHHPKEKAPPEIHWRLL
jgi:hypothetical protein